tara:strand:- start:3500 stop:4798 length:1299 start_codon:yes stop_codon:yes gene_type:complete
MKKNRKKVYVGLAADILHSGHINILKTANSFGDVTVGLLTDTAIATYKKFPYLNFNNRVIIVKNLKYVKNVIAQNSLDYVPNLKKLKPDYVVHGDDWKRGIQKKIRARVVKTLRDWGGKLVEPKYTKGISSSLIKKEIIKSGITPDTRKLRLKRLMESKEIVRILEAHSPLAGLIIENLSLTQKNKFYEFDGMWSSSLTDSTLRGKPDTQSVDYTSRILGLNEIMDVTTKPIIFDGDNGGRIEHLPYLVKSLERTGVSAIVLEDKIGFKKNSLFKDQSKAKQDSIKNFSEKIKVANKSKISDDFLIIARIESLILGKSIADALKRANAYSKAGADAILIHSKDLNPQSIFKFSKKFSKSKFYKPLVAVPSTYSKTREIELIKNGFKIVIYANHLLRASYKSMETAAKIILKNKRTYEMEDKITSIKDILTLI